MTNNADVPAADSSSAEPKYDETTVDPRFDDDEARRTASLSFATVHDDREIRELISAANRNLGVLGFTEHGFRHVGLVSRIAHNVMNRLGYNARYQELAQIAGYVHDIGNVVSRHGHASTGAVLAHTILTRMGMSPEDVIIVMSAIGSHGDDAGRLGEPVHPVSAALILADKSDVHRSRVRVTDPQKFDEHDQMNYATTSSFLRVDPDTQTITLELEIDTSMASVMKYFELFLPRMQMCRRAANLLDQTFRITINDVAVL
ncbi:MAG TPA: HD domain-containing protein [Thermomicrobiales bacterium]|nr:HD domain-containing protein [Thermomicrobiales bacterium]